MMKKMVSAGNEAPTGDGLGRGMRWSDRIRNFVGRSLKAALPGVAIAMASQVQTQADILFELKQIGPDVVLKGSGSVNTTTLLANGWSAGFNNNNYGQLYGAGSQAFVD